MQAFGVGSTPWSPLGRGLLTRPMTEETLRGKTDGFMYFFQQSSIPKIVGRYVYL